jgi:hypothetical protein
MSPLNRFHMYSGDTQPYSFLELLGDLRVVLLQGNDAVGPRCVSLNGSGRRARRVVCFRFTDTICHESDLREALRLSRIGREHWQPFLDVMMLFLGQQLRRHPTLIVRDEHGQQWSCGAGDPTTLLRADGYELLRASYSRRSRRHIAAWNWTPTPNQRLVNSFGVFGPRSDDQPIPIS